MTVLGNSIGYDMWNLVGSSLTQSLARGRLMKVPDFDIWLPSTPIRRALANAYR